MGPCKARAIGLGGAAIGSLVWGVETQPIEYREGGGVLALDGRRSINTPNNQPTVGRSDRGDVLVEARWTASDGNGVGVSFGASNRTIKKIN
jgi:hypothetical protein